MNWILIGSTAAYHWFPDSRVPQDIDILTPAKISGNHSKICVVDAQWHDCAEYIINTNKNKVCCDPDALFTIKVSHAHWNIKWQKTMYDIAFFQSKGCALNMELYSKLFKIWESVHGKKQVNMSKPMTEFFHDHVNRQYDHEFLHQIVAFKSKPMHEVLRPDHGTAWCSEALFNELPIEEKYMACMEECLVTAIERANLTKDSKLSARLAAVNNAYFLMCTSMTTGWFARFLILNQRNLLSSWRSQWEPQLNKSLKLLPLLT